MCPHWAIRGTGWGSGACLLPFSTLGFSLFRIWSSCSLFHDSARNPLEHFERGGLVLWATGGYTCRSTGCGAKTKHSHDRVLCLLLDFAGLPFFCSASLLFFDEIHNFAWQSRFWVLIWSSAVTPVSPAWLASMWGAPLLWHVTMYGVLNRRSNNFTNKDFGTKNIMYFATPQLSTNAPTSRDERRNMSTWQWAESFPDEFFRPLELHNFKQENANVNKHVVIIPLHKMIVGKDFRVQELLQVSIFMKRLPQKWPKSGHLLFRRKT